MTVIYNRTFLHHSPLAICSYIEIFGQCFEHFTVITRSISSLL
jgi:hypothetical protein